LAYARVGDKAQVPADAHGCPGCAHPAVGPGIVGSSEVLLDGRPVMRVGDVGIHAACCGPNMWRVVEGDPSVLINGRPAARIGDKTQHCGGSGKLIEGSPTLVIPGGSGEPGRSEGLPELPPAPETVPAGPNEVEVSTGADQRKLLLFSVGASKQPASALVFPDSAAQRTGSGALSLKKGSALVTTPESGQGTQVNVPVGSVELHSQALISQITAGTRVVLLTGSARLSPKGGAPVQLTQMQQATFSESGLVGAVSAVDPATLQRAFAPMTGAPVPPEESAGPIVMPSPLTLAALGGMLLLVVAFAVVVLGSIVVFIAVRRRRS